MSASTSLTAMVSRFWIWWTGELRALIPGKHQSLGQLPRHILSVEDGGFRIVDTGNGKPQSAPDNRLLSRSEALAELISRARARSDRTAGIRVRYGSCFVRRVDVPAGAEAYASKLLSLDLQRNSPFPASEVRTSHFRDPNLPANGKVPMCQLVIKRSAVDGLVESIQSSGLDVVLIDAWNEDGTAALPVNFLDAGSSERVTRPSIRAAQIAGGVATVAFGVAATYFLIERHEAALRELQAQTSLAKSKALAARDALTRSQAQFNEYGSLYRARSEYPSKPQVIEELTRLIPDSAWINDMRIDGTTIDLTGLAASASNIIQTLERSSTFVDASLTAPLTFDPREDKERFSIRVHVRPTVASSAAQRPERRE